MLIEQQEKNGKGSFFIKDGDKVVAEMTYTMPSPDKMIIDHTEVDDSLGGKGVGLQLVTAGVEYARANLIKIIPLCPFANSVFKKKKEFADVLN